jgi:hypothetical protein
MTRKNKTKLILTAGWILAAGEVRRENVYIRLLQHTHYTLQAGVAHNNRRKAAVNLSQCPTTVTLIYTRTF